MILAINTGQVGGLAAASAIFQSRLDSELRRSIHGPDAESVCLTLHLKSAVYTA